MRQVLRHELRYVVYMYTCTCTGGYMGLCIYIHRNFNNMESSNKTLVMPPLSLFSVEASGGITCIIHMKLVVPCGINAQEVIL